LCPSTTGYGVACGKLGGPPSKAKDATRPIVNQYREGKVKRTPATGSEREPETGCVQTVSAEAEVSAMACLLHNEPASYGWLRG
jgi:hypothetical protein